MLSWREEKVRLVNHFEKLIKKVYEEADVPFTKLSFRYKGERGWWVADFGQFLTLEAYCYQKAHWYSRRIPTFGCKVGIIEQHFKEGWKIVKIIPNEDLTTWIYEKHPLLRKDIRESFEEQRKEFENLFNNKMAILEP